MKTGTPMQMHVIRTRFEGYGKPGPKTILCYDHIPEIRRLLRTEATIGEIAKTLGVMPESLRRFIKQRRICDLRARREFFEMKRSVSEAIE
jgi:hypothetical protein